MFIYKWYLQIHSIQSDLFNFALLVFLNISLLHYATYLHDRIIYYSQQMLNKFLKK